MNNLRIIITVGKVIKQASHVMRRRGTVARICNEDVLKLDGAMINSDCKLVNRNHEVIELKGKVIKIDGKLIKIETVYEKLDFTDWIEDCYIKHTCAGCGRFIRICLSERRGNEYEAEDCPEQGIIVNILEKNKGCISEIIHKSIPRTIDEEDGYKGDPLKRPGLRLSGWPR